ncbi:hypothetical protein L208DRAFT_59970 [Tricholoma matsutake]|nr:hypothetical protein L208DRAFT_59970 [Tricholoma matsutake 945]
MLTTYCDRLNARTYSAEQLDDSIISMANIRNSDKTFMRKSVATESHDIRPQAMHLSSLPDGERRHYSIQHPMPSFSHQNDKRSDMLKVHDRKSILFQV